MFRNFYNPRRRRDKLRRQRRARSRARIARMVVEESEKSCFCDKKEKCCVCENKNWKEDGF